MEGEVNERVYPTQRIQVVLWTSSGTLGLPGLACHSWESGKRSQTKEWGEVAVARGYAQSSSLVFDHRRPPPPPSLLTVFSHSLTCTMASLLERISLPPGAAPAVGPVRSKSNRAAASSGPYVRPFFPSPLTLPHSLPFASLRARTGTNVRQRPT